MNHGRRLGDVPPSPAPAAKLSTRFGEGVASITFGYPQLLTLGHAGLLLLGRGRALCVAAISISSQQIVDLTPLPIYRLLANNSSFTFSLKVRRLEPTLQILF